VGEREAGWFRLVICEKIGIQSMNHC
jgi:hypothetical protein